MGLALTREISNTSDYKSDLSEDSYLTCLESLNSQPDQTHLFTPVPTSRLWRYYFNLHMDNLKLFEEFTPTSSESKLYAPVYYPPNYSDIHNFDPFIYSYPIKPVPHSNTPFYWSLYPNAKLTQLLSGQQYTNLLDAASAEGKDILHFLPPISKYLNSNECYKNNDAQLYTSLFYDATLTPVSSIETFKKLNVIIPKINEQRYKDTDLHSIIYKKDGNEHSSSSSYTKKIVIKVNNNQKRKPKRKKLYTQNRKYKEKKVAANKNNNAYTHPFITRLEAPPPGDFLKGTCAEYIYEYDEYDYKPNSMLSRRISCEYPVLFGFKDQNMINSVSLNNPMHVSPRPIKPPIDYKTFVPKQPLILPNSIKNQLNAQVRKLIDNINTSVFADISKLLLPKFKMSNTNHMPNEDTHTNFVNSIVGPNAQERNQLTIQPPMVSPSTPSFTSKPPSLPHNLLTKSPSLSKSCLKIKQEDSKLVEPSKAVSFNIRSNSIHYYPTNEQDNQNDLINIKKEENGNDSAVSRTLSIDSYLDELHTNPHKDVESLLSKKEHVSLMIKPELVYIEEDKINIPSELKLESLCNSDRSTQASSTSFQSSKSASIDLDFISQNEQAEINEFQIGYGWVLKNSIDEITAHVKPNFPKTEQTLRPRRTTSELYKRIIEEVINLEEYEDLLETTLKKRQSNTLRKDKSKQYNTKRYHDAENLTNWKPPDPA